MEEDEEIFVSAFNWCDNWCERCPLAETCPIMKSERQRRWQHEARGVDPDDMRTVLSDMGGDLARAMAMLEEMAAEEGIDLDSLGDPEPEIPSIAVERLQRTGKSYARATRDATEALSGELGAEEDRQLAELIHQSMIVARKCARLGGYIERTGGPAVELGSWSLDAVPNLLLMEIVTRRLRDAVEALLEGPTRERFEKLHADLERCLAPLYAAVPDEARREMATRIARREAPSPFCTEELPERGPDREG